MKALKVKRNNSLRSLVRRGLVILSVLALAFTFAACGSDNGDNGYVPPPPPGNGGTTPPARTVSMIEIVNQPTGVSFQGLEPNLEGLVARVFWSDGQVETVREPSRFMTFPQFANNSWEADASRLVDYTMNWSLTNESQGRARLRGVFSLGLREAPGAFSTGLELPQIVPIETIHVQGVPETWYVDQSPNFSGLTVILQHARYVPYNVAIPGSFANTATNRSIMPQARNLPMTALFPRFDLRNATNPDNPTITLMIGSSDADYPYAEMYTGHARHRSFDDQKDNIQNYVPPNRTRPQDGVLGVQQGGDYRELTFGINQLVMPIGIEVAEASWPRIADDDLGLFFSRVAAADANRDSVNTAAWVDWNDAAAARTLTVFRNANLRLRVFYNNASNRVIDMNEYEANMSRMGWHNVPNARQSDDESRFWIQEPRQFKNEVLDPRGGTANPEMEVAIFDFQEDPEDGENYLNFIMFYGFNPYGQDQRSVWDQLGLQGSAIVTSFVVAVPVYNFDDIAIARRPGTPGAGQNIVLRGTLGSDGGIGTGTGKVMTHEQARAINDRWVLTATYSRGRETMTREIPFNRTFFARFLDGTDLDVMNLRYPRSNRAGTDPIFTDPSSPPDVTVPVYLDVTYRGVLLRGEGDTVEVYISGENWLGY